MPRFLIFLSLFIFAQAAYSQDYEGYTIDNINIETNWTKPDVLKSRFYLKEGDTVDKESFEKAQERLHGMRIFKNIDFSAEPKEDNKVDINIKADDGYFFFPMFFITGGSKNAMSISLAEGNYFKRGETAFIMGAFAEDGGLGNMGFTLGRNMYDLRISKLNFDERFYNDGWSSNYGVFASADDEGKYGTPKAQIHTKKESYSFLFATSLGFATVLISPIIENVSYDKDLGEGRYNKLSVGIRKSSHMPQAANLGALFGFGLSDKEKSLRDLPGKIYGYSLSANYTGGGNWTGADFDINKFSLDSSFLVEFESRNIFLISVKAAQSVNATLNESILSVDLLSGAGSYNRQILGSKGLGLTASYTYYILRDKTGLLAIEPFYQIAYVSQSKGYLDHSGTGATIFYKLWRFPFPLGASFTHNLSDSSNKISAFFGAAF